MQCWIGEFLLQVNKAKVKRLTEFILDKNEGSFYPLKSHVAILQFWLTFVRKFGQSFHACEQKLKSTNPINIPDL